MNPKIFSATILLLIFFLLFPCIEIVFFDNEEREMDLILFLLFQTTSLIVAFFICSKASFLKIKEIDSASIFLDEKYISKSIFILSILFFSIFLFFCISNIQNFDDITKFSERYRNAYYKGSGLYTAGMIQFLPFVLSLLIAKCKKMNIYIYLCLLMLMATSLLLGQRIILLGILFFSTIRLMTSKKRKTSLIVISFLCLFFISYKLLLNNGMSDSSLKDILLHIAGRIRYRYIVYDSNFSYDLSDFFGFVSYSIMPTLGSLEAWKESFALSIPNIMDNMPFISLFSGLAFPYPVIVFNIFGFFGFILVFPVIIIFILSLKKLYESTSILSSTWYLYSTQFSFSILIEDIYQFSKIPLMLLLILFINVFFIFLKKQIRR
ncbi:hypothetical protein GKR48_10800 [Providencia sp. wls1943]|uniref:Wzy n=1 Tax=Providencia alcalifaciens TaxID=126385 RepID=A0A346CLL1_9GAMM|nr:hypothetical protein [Providencia sp. wls1943]AXL96485.1 hypothetical protein [Providencia alcalifaciens]MTB67307.1 hypothetical protein [Providencia sp. wls1943]